LYSWFVNVNQGENNGTAVRTGGHISRQWRDGGQATTSAHHGHCSQHMGPACMDGKPATLHEFIRSVYLVWGCDVDYGLSTVGHKVLLVWGCDVD